jgi:hypothetical protein
MNYIRMFFNFIFLISVCFNLHTKVLFTSFFHNYITHEYFHGFITIKVYSIFIYKKLIHW